MVVLGRVEVVATLAQLWSRKVEGRRQALHAAQTTEL